MDLSGTVTEVTPFAKIPFKTTFLRVLLQAFEEARSTPPPPPPSAPPSPVLLDNARYRLYERVRIFLLTRLCKKRCVLAVP